ncbi:MAG TPA: glutamate--tRNA ligase [Streptosporangiaceae bacterium]|nr:glutamate--tRNA ligase [Streptosporangiaceae bacterium]
MTSHLPGQVRVRIAPSPTGDPHVGTAYAALFNTGFARTNNGRFVLRIEDTDRKRFAEGSEQQIYHTLRWLGFEWDEGPDIGGPAGPYRQSERLEFYDSAAQKLLRSGHAYYCWCSAERLAELRKTQAEQHSTPGYDRMCLGLSENERARLPGFSPVPVVRMLVPADIELQFDDLIRGRVGSPRPDDQVLMKSDGFPTYHLAAAVDDHLMGITHIIRGEEWMSSTVKQRQLFTWLDWDSPQYAHFPLLRNTDKSKISKRKNPAARLLWFEEQGYLPQALLNFLALLGYSMPSGAEKFSLREFIAEFDLKRLKTVGPVFDVEKLKWLDGLYIRELSEGDFLEQAQPFLPSEIATEDLSFILRSLQQRTKCLSELQDELQWLVNYSVPSVASLSAKGLPAEEVVPMLKAVADLFAQIAVFTPVQIEAALDEFVAKHGLNRRRLFMTMRIALVGGPIAPPLHDTIATLGRDRSINRLLTCIAVASGG